MLRSLKFGFVLFFIVSLVFNVSATDPISSGQNTSEQIKYMRQLLNGGFGELTEADRMMGNGALALMLKYSGPDNWHEADSLIQTTLKWEMAQPENLRRSFIFQNIAAYELLSKNNEAALNAIKLAEKYNKIKPDFTNDDYLSFRNNMLSVYRTAGDSNSARRIATADIVMLNKIQDESIPASDNLISYLWNCYKVFFYENSKDNAAIVNCFNLIQKHTARQLAAVGPENFKLQFLSDLLMAISQPFFLKYTDPDTISNMYQQVTTLFKSRKLSDQDKITFAGFLYNKANYFMSRNDLEEAAKAADMMYECIASNGSILDDLVQMKLYMIMWDIAMKRNDLEKMEKYYSLFRHFAESSGQDNNIFKSLFAKFDSLIAVLSDNKEESIANAINSYEIIKNEWDAQLPFMSNSDLENFLASSGDPASGILFVLTKYPDELSAEAYNAVLYRTGIQLRAQKNFKNLIETSKNREVKELYDSIQILNKNISREDYGNIKSYNDRLKIRDIEYKLVSLIKNEKTDFGKLPEWKDVRKKLKKDEAAIEMIFTGDSLFAMALILRNDSKKPEAVCLTKAKDLINFLKSKSKSNTSSLAGYANKLYSDEECRLYEMLWLPIEPYLKDIKTIYLSVAGVMNILSFNAIPTLDGKTLFDRYDIRQLTTTGVLANMPAYKSPKSALIVGDVDFSGIDTNNSDNNASNREVVDIDDFSDRGVSRIHFRRLPYTAMEADSVSKIMGKIKHTVLTRNNASEAELRRRLSDNPDLLHLATHGFFLSDVQSAIKVPYMKQHANLAASSMQRAGVALAGAENAWRGRGEEDDSDGILTALEVAEMNLEGVKLVTLSACETALGNFSFEGVYGLPRGFKQAGVQSLLVSLWSVDDRATSLFMTEFYRNWLSGSSLREAHREATAKVRSEFPSPAFWAPFILLDAN